MPTYCEDCDNVESASRKQEWYRHRCLKAPKERPLQYVVGDPFLTEPPFKLCRDINPRGDCKLFSPRKE